MNISEMISKLDRAIGRLLVLAIKDPVAEEAMKLVKEVSVALGEMTADKPISYKPMEVD